MNQAPAAQLLQASLQGVDGSERKYYYVISPGLKIMLFCSYNKGCLIVIIYARLQNMELDLLLAPVLHG